MGISGTLTKVEIRCHSLFDLHFHPILQPSLPRIWLLTAASVSVIRDSQVLLSSERPQHTFHSPKQAQTDSDLLGVSQDVGLRTHSLAITIANIIPM